MALTKSDSTMFYIDTNISVIKEMLLCLPFELASLDYDLKIRWRDLDQHEDRQSVYEYFLIKWDELLEEGMDIDMVRGWMLTHYIILKDRKDDTMHVRWMNP